ncbi:uncharacterized protein LOC121745864 [Salvia splendens]|uniref:uncharacterized protein LOC121745864 n=1 Tax=Salvia splendens TaxID=180675 RepID=UPI001C25CB42|nr:uncharacterized protein LOC121745864 [Salvia splendens]
MAIQPSDLPPKKTDPGVFTLPISIRDVQMEYTMCDLGASINIMLYSIHEKLGEAKLVKTGMVIQLADESCIRPEGILEDEIVKVNKFKYPTNFFVMKMTEPGAEESTGVLLGRPFLSTASTVIDVRHGTMKLGFNGEQLTFDIDKAVRKSHDGESIQSIDAISPWERKYLENEPFKEPPSGSTEDKQLKREAAEWFEATMNWEMDDQAIEREIIDFCKPPRPAESEEITQPEGVEEPPDQAASLKGMLKENPSPTRQLLPLPTSPVTLKSLSNQAYQEPVKPSLQGQREQLMEKLRLGQNVVKWKTAKVNPDLCMYPSMIEEGVTSHLDRQRRLDPALRKEELIAGQEELLF